MAVDIPRAVPRAAEVRFLLDADASPGLLPRLLQPFARRELIASRMWSHLGPQGMHVEIAVMAIDAVEANLVEGNLRQVIGVRQVLRVDPECLRHAA
ncbi:MAG: hypothetical protein AB7O80_14290 [Acetobacteraceae bacterium]